jgi:hypothetical protein
MEKCPGTGPKTGLHCSTQVARYKTLKTSLVHIVKTRTDFPFSQLTACGAVTTLSNLKQAAAVSNRSLHPLNGSPKQPHPVAEAMEWVAVLTTIALEMVLPAIAGQWLDRRLGSKYLVLVGLVLGVTVGMWHLVRITKPKSNSPD